MRLSIAQLVGVALAAVAITLVGSNLVGAQNESTDRAKARKLLQRSRAGETLTKEEQAFLHQGLRELRRSRGNNPSSSSKIKMPEISDKVCPVSELRVSDTSYAAIRKPPGKGPFPAVVFMHGGLGQTKMSKLRENATSQPTQTRFLAWGYVIVCATRRDIRHNPLDRGLVTDSLALVEAVRALPEVDPNSVVLYGGSGGGTLALEVASVTNHVAAIAAGEPATIIYMGMFNKKHVVRNEKGKVTGDRRQDVMSADPKSLYTEELKHYTRKKMKGIECPVLILHGDRHLLKGFNLDVFVPELKTLGKNVTVEIYPGENHGFYWGRSNNPNMPLKANRDANLFFQKVVTSQPQPIDRKLIKMVAVP